MRKDFFQGIRKSLENAQELFEEAQILKDHNKLARSYTLFQLCIEESGKAVLIFSYLLNDNLNDQIQYKKFKKAFLDHTSKTDASLSLDLILTMVMEGNDELKKTLVLNNFIQKENLKKINDYKNLSLYTSIDEGKFHKPSELINKDLIEKIEFNAFIRLKVGQQFYEVAMENFDEILNNSRQIDEIEYINQMASKLRDIINK